MSMSAETIIALLALLVACVPGVWFIVKHNARIRRWWNSNQGQHIRSTSFHTHRHEGSGSDSFYALGSSRQNPNFRTARPQTVLPFFNPFDPMLYRSSSARAGSTTQQSETTFIFYRAVVDMIPDREEPYAGV